MRSSASAPGETSDVNPIGTAARRLAVVGLLVVAALYLVDFHLDVRARDAFAWMDPYQYYGFARQFAAGQVSFDQFELPSIFPFFMAPFLSISATIPAALWTNGAFLLLLLLAIHLLCRELELAAYSPAVALLILTSPLLIGLSRTVYVEFALTALAAWTLLAWVRFLGKPVVRRGLLLGLLVSLGFLTKMTFPLFLILPGLAAVVGLWNGGRRRPALLLIGSVGLAGLLVVLIQAVFFPATLEYYRTLGNTTMPIMYLLGPPERFSVDSLTYYFVQLWKQMLWLLSPLLLLPLIQLVRTLPRSLAGRDVALWAWLIGPLLLLVLQPVKEPRHVAPCVVPAVLLLVSALARLTSSPLRRGLLLLAVAAGLANYLAVTRTERLTPYFLDRPLHLERVVAALSEQSGDEAVYAATPPANRNMHWKYNRNVALAGFEPNAALALTWRMFPGITYDLDTLGDPQRLSDEIPYESFEDLFILAGFNTYNRRCGWNESYLSLTRDEILADAEFLLLNSDDTAAAKSDYPDHRLVRTIGSGDDTILLLRATGPRRTPFRVRYAERFMSRDKALGPGEQAVIANELLLTHVLAGDLQAADAVIARLPPPAGELRNIYWIGGYQALHEQARRTYRRHRSGKGN